LFQKKYSVAANHAYYRSICSHCEAAQGDNYIISGFNSPLYPIDINDFNKIQFFKIDREIQVCAGSNSIGYEVTRGKSSVTRRNIWKN
jgi:hypothetical protein